MDSTFPYWLVLVGVPSFLYAVCNHIDKHLLERHFRGNVGVLTLLVISALVSVVALPILWLLSPTSLIPEDWSHILVFSLVGALHAALLWFYLTALSEEDTTTIIIFYSVLPVIGLWSSNLFLGETLSPAQFIAMAVIILGVLIVSFEKGEDNKHRFKIRAAFLMFMASLCWALGDVAFKFVALEENVWRSLFWEHLILFLVGAVMFAFAPSVRAQLKEAMVLNSRKILGFNLTSEVLYIAANVISAFPLMMVQVAVVHLVQALQPVWVFLIALGFWLSGRSSESFTRRQLVQKSLATVIAVYGTYILANSTPA